MKAVVGLLLVLAGSARAADLAEIQTLLRAQKLDGWLLYDFRGMNGIAREVVRPVGVGSRRWFYLIPAQGEPVAIVHKIETQGFEKVAGKKVTYAAWRELETQLATVLRGKRRVAMEVSDTLPAVSRVDVGTVTMVRRAGAEVVSSALLVQAAKSRWGAGRATHDAAVRILVAQKDTAFAEIARRIRAGDKVTEGDIAARIRDGMKAAGLAAEWPIVAAGENGANPHYAPAEHGSREIRRGDVVIIDMASRNEGDPAAICADMTFVGYVGDVVPKEVADVFAVVARARDATVAFLTERFRDGKPVRGFEADGVARGVIARAGYAEFFIHRTGHSIDTRVHGDGANLDDFETHDTRPFIPDTGFSVEPGIYLPGKFGIRSEIDCHIDGNKVEVTTPLQTEVTPILAGG